MFLSQTRQPAIRSLHHGKLGSKAKYLHHKFPSSEAGHWKVYIPVQFPRVLGKNYSLRVLNSRYFQTVDRNQGARILVPGKKSLGPKNVEIGSQSLTGDIKTPGTHRLGNTALIISYYWRYWDPFTAYVKVIFSYKGWLGTTCNRRLNGKKRQC